MLSFLLFAYVVTNIILYFYFGISVVPKILDNGFYMKHLIIGLIFFPASIAVIALLIVFGIIVAIVEGVKKLLKADFFNKKLF